MDAERLAEIEARAEAANSEPWSGAAVRFILLARQDVPDLLVEIARLTAEREEYERTRWTVVAQRNGALNDLETANAELSRLRAVIEEARAAVAEGMAHYDRWIGAREMLKLLDRGLKGKCQCRDLGKWGTDTRDCPLHLETSVVIDGVGKFGTTHGDRGLKGAGDE